MRRADWIRTVPLALFVGAIVAACGGGPTRIGLGPWRGEASGEARFAEIVEALESRRYEILQSDPHLGFAVVTRDSIPWPYRIRVQLYANDWATVELVDRGLRPVFKGRVGGAATEALDRLALALAPVIRGAEGEARAGDAAADHATDGPGDDASDEAPGDGVGATRGSASEADADAKRGGLSEEERDSSAEPAPEIGVIE